MTFRSLAVPAALAALLASLWGCAGKSISTEPTAQDPLAAGNAAFAQKDYAKACQELSRAGGGAETQYKAGFSCARDGEAKAERAYKAALTADPKYAAALEGLGLSAFAASDLNQAKQLLEAGAKAGGKDAKAALALAQTSLLLGQCGPALAAFQEASRRDPGLLAARTGLEAARQLCGARKTAGAAPTASPTHAGSSSVSGTTGSSGGLSGSVPAAGTKEAPKGKPATKTIDLNDI